MKYIFQVPVTNIHLVNYWKLLQPAMLVRRPKQPEQYLLVTRAR